MTEQDILAAILGLMLQGQYDAARENLEGPLRGLPSKPSQPGYKESEQPLELVFDPHGPEIPEVIFNENDWCMVIDPSGEWDIENERVNKVLADLAKKFGPIGTIGAAQMLMHKLESTLKDLRVYGILKKKGE